MINLVQLDKLQLLVISHAIVECYVILQLNSTYRSFQSLHPFICLLLQHQFQISYGINLHSQTCSFGTGKYIEISSDKCSKNHYPIYISSEVLEQIQFTVVGPRNAFLNQEEE
ncbi:Hypothetical_protein [Hexamita inflata]|uniref:Hypothetical_protein n=1 Tax=Hexamita inflata TaxID=28002 RepID=A0AA86QB91_9EUKA|nr:Hypothetical protein HINF_LOCUS43295 [Hexamita inflata]